MAVYKAPIRDLQFVLHEVLNVEQALKGLPAGEDLSADLIDAVLDELGRVCEQVVFPTNAIGDEQGCRLENGVVRSPDGFKEAYDELAEGGWYGLAADREYGGQGLPDTLAFVAEEMLWSANASLNLYPILTKGAYRAIYHHADDSLKALYLPKLVSGQWAGTMCLTESHSGTDLGLLRTRAVPADDGSYRITGTKIFITGGEQDVTENIIHLVLARLPGAPPGVKGISLFLVPKFLLKDGGELGKRNSAMCQALEKKMGIKAASCCVMGFDDAVGFLVGEPHRGLRAMFTMMNHERLAIGLQGLAHAEVAYQSAAAYAHERLQGRAPGGAARPDDAADSILVHPDVRRMLLTARSMNEAARAFYVWLAIRLDLSRHPEPTKRREADSLVALLTPVVKAFFTDYGFEACNLGLQVFGGHGYVRDHGMEQLVRDARIAQLYEGTSGVQALDLVGRKLNMEDGAVMRGYIQSMRETARSCLELEGLAQTIKPFAQAVETLDETTEWLLTNMPGDKALAGAASCDYLKMVGLVSFGFMWAKMAAIAAPKRDQPFYANKLLVADFFMYKVLPQVGSLTMSIQAGSQPLMAMDSTAFTA